MGHRPEPEKNGGKNTERKKRLMEQGIVLKTCKLAFGALISFLTGLHLMIQIFLYAILMDIVTGLVASWATKTIDSDISRRGMAKKTMMIVAVSGAEILGRMAGFTMNVPWGGEWGMGAAVAGYYAIQEGISITENIGRAGLPLPKFLIDRLEKLKELSNQ